MLLVHQAIEKSRLFVLLFSDAVAAIAVELSQVADPIVPAAIRRVHPLIIVD
jgi:hypothetical protein